MRQLLSVLSDIEISAMKTGMLFDDSNIRAIAKTLKAFYISGKTLPPLVCDPVCVSTSGHTLLQPEALDVLISELFPLTFLLTPNKSEAELILSARGIDNAEITNLEGMQGFHHGNLQRDAPFMWFYGAIRKIWDMSWFFPFQGYFEWTTLYAGDIRQLFVS